MNLTVPWRWNRFGSETFFLDAGAGVAVMAGSDRAAADQEAWRYRASGTRARRVQIVREVDGTEVLGVSLDWAGSGVIDGTPGWRWERMSPRNARIVDGQGSRLLYFTRDADPSTGASIEIVGEVPDDTAVLLATFAWLVVHNEPTGTVMVGATREVRRFWR